MHVITTATGEQSLILDGLTYPIDQVRVAEAEVARYHEELRRMEQAYDDGARAAEDDAAHQGLEAYAPVENPHGLPVLRSAWQRGYVARSAALRARAAEHDRDTWRNEAVRMSEAYSSLRTAHEALKSALAHKEAALARITTAYEALTGVQTAGRVLTGGLARKGRA